MPPIRRTCPHCGKSTGEKNHSIAYNFRFIRLECGHTLTERLKLTPEGKVQESYVDPYEQIVSIDNKRPYPFQIKTSKFGERSGFRFLNANQMGLGKTLTPFLLGKVHPEEIFPLLILCKSGLKYQWMYETLRWMNKDYVPQIIDGGNEKPLPEYFKVFIVSLDLLWRAKWAKDLKVKCVVVDECQLIKNPDSKRTKAVRTFIQDRTTTGPDNINVIALSGTPIKNNAGEFFTILNLLRPEVFPTQAGFYFDWVNTYDDGYTVRAGGLKPHRIEAFKEKTKDFIIRYERSEVMPELPAIERKFRHVELDVETEEAYKKAFLEFRDDFNAEGETSLFEKSGNMLARLSRLRHLAGLSKVGPTVDFLADFLMETDEKIVIFHHHKDVGVILNERLKSLCADGAFAQPLVLTSELDSDQRNNIVQQFTNEPRKRILIASTLASGEGLNLQVCSNCIIMERQWNPANEEQAEARFTRIGSTADSVSATYMIASGTIDEFFTELVERKREVVNSTLRQEEGVRWDQSSLMRDLAAVLAVKGGKKWRI